LEHYVTLFDSLFLPQGLALHASLSRHAGNFTLWVLCLDERTKHVLDSVGAPTLRTISLSEVESDELLGVKPKRTRAEYCWTLTPYTPKIVFDRAPDARRVTYVDADVFVLRSPREIFEEFERSGKAVMITDHAYDAEYDHAAVVGQFCVQFMTFVRGSSEPVRRWWQDRCIEWCSETPQDGKLGDQKYLDDWPTRFGRLVHVLQQIDLLLAPWNARRFPYSRAVAWHFQGLRLLSKRRVLLHGPYSVPEIVHQMVYEPYLAELARSVQILGGYAVQKKTTHPLIRYPLEIARNLKREVRRLLRHRAPVRTMPEPAAATARQLRASPYGEASGASGRSTG